MNLFEKYSHEDYAPTEEAEATPVIEVEVGAVTPDRPLVFEDEVGEYETAAQGLERLHEIADRYHGQASTTFGLEDALSGVDATYAEHLPAVAKVDTYIKGIMSYQKDRITKAINNLQERANEPLTDACLVDIKTRLGKAKTYFDTIADDQTFTFKDVITPTLVIEDTLSCFDEEAWSDFNAIIDFLNEFRAYRETAVDALKEGKRLGGDDGIAYIKKAVDAAPMLPGRLSEEPNPSLQRKLPAIVGAYTFQNLHLIQFQLEPKWSDIDTALKEFLYTHSVDVKTEPLTEYPTTDVQADGVVIKACIEAATEALTDLSTLIAPLKGNTSSVDGTYYVPAINFLVPALTTIETFTTMLNSAIGKLDADDLDEIFSQEWFF